MSSLASSCRFSGALPRLNGTLMIELDMSQNELSGTLPNEWPSSLKNLRLYGNEFEGTIPASLWVSAKLSELSLGDNRLNGTLSGALEASHVQTLSVGSTPHGGECRTSMRLTHGTRRMALGLVRLSW